MFARCFWREPTKDFRFSVGVEPAFAISTKQVVLYLVRVPHRCRLRSGHDGALLWIQRGRHEVAFLKLCVGPAEPAVSWVWHVRFSFVTPRWSRQGNRGGSAQPGRTPGDCRLWGELWDRHRVPGRESPVPIKKTFLPPSARTEVGRGCEKIYCARISRCIPRRAKQGHSLALASRRCSESLCISYIHSGCSSQPWDSSLRGLRPFRSRRNGLRSSGKPAPGSGPVWRADDTARPPFARTVFSQTLRPRPRH